MPKYKCFVTQMVEQVGYFYVEAPNLEEATRIANAADAWSECEALGTWAPGDDAMDADVWLIERVRRSPYIRRGDEYENHMRSKFAD